MRQVIPYNGIHRSIVNWSWRVHVSSVYVHSAICETYLVSTWYSIHLLSIGVERYIYPQYRCILLYVKLIWCNGIPLIYCQLEWGIHVFSVYVHSTICVTYLLCGISEIYCELDLGGRCILSICAFCYMWHWFGVMVFHRSIVNWSVERGVYVSSVYVHSVICETYVV